jgi:hypothetical protein
MRRLPITLCALIVSVACFSYRPEATLAPGPDRVRVRFDPPERVNVAVAGRDTLRLAGVTELVGRVLEVRGDSLKLDVRDWRTRGDVPRRLGRGSSTAVVKLGPGRVVDVWRVDRARTGLAVLGTAALGLFAAITAVSAPVY